MRTINHIINGLPVRVTISPDTEAGDPADGGTTGRFLRVTDAYLAIYGADPGHRIVVVGRTGGVRGKPSAVYSYDHAGAVRAFSEMMTEAEAIAAADAEYKWMQDYYRNLWEYAVVTVWDAYGNGVGLGGCEIYRNWSDEETLICLADTIHTLAHTLVGDHQKTLMDSHVVGLFPAYIEALG